jgi:hypothetical protein
VRVDDRDLATTKSAVKPLLVPSAWYEVYKVGKIVIFALKQVEKGVIQRGY